MTDLFEPKPRWPGAPPICLAENHLSFSSVAELEKFHRDNGPGCQILKMWQCEVCRHWHFLASSPDPTGSSSGTGRSSKKG